MSPSLDDRRLRLADLLRREPGGSQALVDRLDQLLVRSGEAAGALGIVGARGGSRLASARFAIELLDDDARLSQRDSSSEDLAVLEWALRPALPIAGIAPAAAAGIWPALGDLQLSEAAERSCRIDVEVAGARRIQVGSGVILRGDGTEWTIASAAHVAADMRAAGWSARGDVGGWAVAGHDPAATDARPASLRPEVRSHPDRDLAILTAASDVPFVEIRLGEGPASGGALAVLGYPFFDSRRDDWARDFGFREPAGVLRISPGIALASEPQAWSGSSAPMIAHDASTLSGSSGSGVFELPGLGLVGIHVGGWAAGGDVGDTAPFASNVAVPIGELRGESEWPM